MQPNSPTKLRWSVRGLLILTTLAAVLCAVGIPTLTRQSPYQRWAEGARRQEASFPQALVTITAAAIVPLALTWLLLSRLSREAAFYTALFLAFTCFVAINFAASYAMHDYSIASKARDIELTIYQLTCGATLLGLGSVLFGAVGVLFATRNRQVTIVTPRLEMELESLDQAHERLANMPEEHRVMISPEWLKRFEEATTGDFWTLGFSIRLLDNQQAIGQCGFKGPPTEDGTVEIAYTIDDEHQRQGYATEAANGLTRFAFRQPEVQVVCAHTLPEVNASTRVLTKCGFTKVGESVDPEDGPVWRWEILPGELPE